MGIPVLILGEPGAGKSASLRNFSPAEVGVFSVASKPLPFPRAFMTVNGPDCAAIRKNLAKATLRRYVVDDCQYLPLFQALDRGGEDGPRELYDLVRFCTKNLPQDVVVYFLHHAQTVNGMVRAPQPQGWPPLEGLFPVVLLCTASPGTWRFLTQGRGCSTAKSPFGMLPPEMNNDLRQVDDAVRSYWSLGPQEPPEGLFSPDCSSLNGRGAVLWDNPLTGVPHRKIFPSEATL